MAKPFTPSTLKKHDDNNKNLKWSNMKINTENPSSNYNY